MKQILMMVLVLVVPGMAAANTCPAVATLSNCTGCSAPGTDISSAALLVRADCQGFRGPLTGSCVCNHNSGIGTLAFTGSAGNPVLCGPLPSCGTLYSNNHDEWWINTVLCTRGVTGTWNTTLSLLTQTAQINGTFSCGNSSSPGTSPNNQCWCHITNVDGMECTFSWTPVSLAHGDNTSCNTAGGGCGGCGLACANSIAGLRNIFWGL